jgi:hypothetical protein
MSSIVLSGDTSGTVTVSVPAVAGTNTVTVPASTGTVVLANANGYVLTPSNPTFLVYGSDAAFTGTTVPYNSATLNIGSNFNTSTYTFTAPVAGVYIFSWQFFNSPNTAAAVDFYKNSAAIGRYGTESTSITNYSGWSGSIIVSLAVGDTARMVRFAGTVHMNINNSYFAGRLLG